MNRTGEFRQLIPPSDATAPAGPARRTDERYVLATQIITESTAILEGLQGVEGRIRAAKEEKDLPEFSLVPGRISAVQDKVDRVAELERPAKGWFGASGPETPSQLVQHLSTVVWYLSHRYSGLVKLYDQVQERKRAEKDHLRVVNEKRMAALASLQAKKSPTAQAAPVLQEERKMSTEEFSTKYGLSSDQMQMLQNENQQLFQELSDRQSQVRQVQKGVAEIARLQAALQESLIYQEHQIERIDDDTDLAMDMVKKGNVYLAKSSKNQSFFSKIVVCLVLFFTFIMLFMHFYLPPR